MEGEDDTAIKIADRLLQASGRALITGNVAAFVPLFVLPHKIETFDGISELISTEDVSATFRRVRSHMIRSGVTDMVRHVVAARFENNDVIASTHETRLVSGDTLVQEPFRVFSILWRVGDEWKLASSQYAIADCEDYNHALMAGPAGPNPPHHKGRSGL